MLTILTPTSGRPLAFEYLKQWIDQQNYNDSLQWIVSCDDWQDYTFPSTCTSILNPPDQMPKGMHSLNYNLICTLPYIRGDYILIMEDDDYYTSEFISIMDQFLESYNLVGISPTRYYNVATRRVRTIANSDHASLAHTGFHASLLPLFTEILNQSKPFIDLAFWRSFHGSKYIHQSNNIHVGIKGMPGKRGIGIGHKQEFGYPDPRLRIFREWSIPESYKQYFNPSSALVPSAAPPASSYQFIAPGQSKHLRKPHHGVLSRKPWDYPVTVCMAHLDTPDIIPTTIALHNLQTIKPYILVIDTGSSDENSALLELNRAENVEIHYLRGHGWLHSSEVIAAALDVAHAVCRTEFLFHTHVDCFLRRRDWLAYLMSICNSTNPVVGYQMSERRNAEADLCIGHVAAMCHVPTLVRHGVTWNMARHHDLRATHTFAGGWPDTETGFNRCIRAAGFMPQFVGRETNYERQITNDFDHPRHYTASNVYTVASHIYRINRAAWMEAALSDAKLRIHEWESDY